MLRIAAAVIAGAMLLTACGVVEDARNTASNVGVCADAVRIATFSPDTADPQATVDKAHAAGDELAGLADRAADTTAAQAIDGLATAMRETTLTDLTSAPAAWVQKKADQVGALTRTCRL
ncbi:bacteriophage spanin2 family protein [Kibdelosporangium lantanae]